jgi:hypothetical protein
LLSHRFAQQKIHYTAEGSKCAKYGYVQCAWHHLRRQAGQRRGSAALRRERQTTFGVIVTEQAEDRKDKMDFRISHAGRGDLPPLLGPALSLCARTLVCAAAQIALSQLSVAAALKRTALSCENRSTAETEQPTPPDELFFVAPSIRIFPPPSFCEV